MYVYKMTCMIQYPCSKHASSPSLPHQAMLVHICFLFIRSALSLTTLILGSGEQSFYYSVPTVSYKIVVYTNQPSILSVFWPFTQWTTGGGALEWQEGVSKLVHGHTKSTLITYFSGMKIDPKYAFFVTCPSCPFQNLSIWPKTHHFSNFACFVPLNDIRVYSAWSWKTTLITWIREFLESLPMTFDCPPPSTTSIQHVRMHWRTKIFCNRVMHFAN